MRNPFMVGGALWKVTYQYPSTILLSTLLLLSACDLSPDMALPDVPTPNAFKEDTESDASTLEPITEGKWKRFDDTAQIEEFAWWRMFGDAKLDALMEQAMKDNPSLEVARNRVTSAWATADTREAALYPSIEVGAGPERQRQSPASQQVFSPPGTPLNVKPYTLYNLRGTISYELDLFGRNRARLRAAIEDAKAEQSTYRAARLALQAELAQTYYRIAALRAEYNALKETVIAREKSFALMNEKLKAGSIDTLVMATSETELSVARGESASVAQALSVNEHALATLVGVPPSELTILVSDLASAAPIIPAGIPASLLERRPDIQQAVASIAAANERIGIARSGYFPDISLSAMGGLVSSDLNDIFRWSNRTWMLGPMVGTVLTQPIFEGGRLAAARAQTQADYQAAVANYRASVLIAFREVEDQLSGLRNANEQTDAAEAGLAAAKRAHQAASERFKVGYFSHLEFLDAERGLLAAKRAQAQARGNQYITTIELVRALGGSWQAPSDKNGERGKGDKGDTNGKE